MHTLVYFLQCIQLFNKVDQVENVVVGSLETKDHMQCRSRPRVLTEKKKGFKQRLLTKKKQTMHGACRCSIMFLLIPLTSQSTKN